MLYQCLVMLLTQDERNTIQLWNGKFHVAGHPSGNLLLQIIIQESHLDSNMTTLVIRLQLTQLDKYMRKSTVMSSSSVNQHVQELLMALNARGGPCRTYSL
jgi:hypothetical protein